MSGEGWTPVCSSSPSSVPSTSPVASSTAGAAPRQRRLEREKEIVTATGMEQ